MQLNALIGKKTYQKQGFLQDGTRVPLTGVVVAGNIVTQIKTQAKEGYNAIQLGIDAKKRANKAIQGHSAKALKSLSASSAISPAKEISKTSTNLTSPKYFKEIRLENVDDAILGSEIQITEVFSAGDVIDVTGISKGKGWAGGVKRWGFHGGPRTHGQSDRERSPGSIGQTTTPGRVYKGKKMAGRMGSDTVTVKNLEIIEITDDGVLLIKGLVPGSVNGMLIVKKTGENKKFVPLYKEVIEEPAVEEVSVEVEATQEAPVIVEEKADAVVEEVAATARDEVKASEEPVVVTEEAKISAEEVKKDTLVNSVQEGKVA